jgi:predicted ATPase
VTFIVGENGCGKSTFLEAIAIAWGFNPEGGTVNFRFSTRGTESDLWRHVQLVKSIAKPANGFFLRAETLFNLATDIEHLDAEPSTAPPIMNSYGRRSLHEQSHGESFLALLNHRFTGDGFYVLDEPEAALSPTRQLSVIRRIHTLVSGNAQFIIATHSPFLLAYPRSKIIRLNEDGFAEISYEDTDHYLVAKRFMINPKGMLEKLLLDD